MIRLLACAGADVNQASRSGISPFAAAGRSAAAVAFLAEVVGVTAVLRGACPFVPFEPKQISDSGDWPTFPEGTKLAHVFALQDNERINFAVAPLSSQIRQLGDNPDTLPNGGPEILLAAHRRLALALGLAARSSALQWLQDGSFDLTHKICRHLAFSRRNGPEAWRRHGQWQRLYNELNRRYAGWDIMHEHGREAGPVIHAATPALARAVSNMRGFVGIDDLDQDLQDAIEASLWQRD